MDLNLLKMNKSVSTVALSGRWSIARKKIEICSLFMSNITVLPDIQLRNQNMSDMSHMSYLLKAVFLFHIFPKT